MLEAFHRIRVGFADDLLKHRLRLLFTLPRNHKSIQSDSDLMLIACRFFTDIRDLQTDAVRRIPISEIPV